MYAALSTSGTHKERLQEIALSLPAEDWEVREHYPFMYFINKEAATPNQGWKIHVSCLADELFDLLECIWDVLINEKICFKIVAAYEDILQFNSGEAGLTQVGKIITIYPRDTDHAYTLGQKLDSIWNRSHTPTPPSDLYFRPGGNVSLRFGAINNEQVIVHHDLKLYPALIDPDGQQVPDISQKDGKQVAWAPALPQELSANNYFGKELDFFQAITGDRYVIVYPLVKKTFTSTFLVMDMDEVKAVLLKIFYKRTDKNQDGMDVLDSGKNELAIAAYLAKAGVAPNILTNYEDDYFYYTVSDYILGSHYAALPKEKRLRMLPVLLEKLQQMHDLGIVHRDLKLANIMVQDEELYFIDFALSVKEGTADPIDAGTKNYVPPEHKDAVAKPSYDCYSLGSCLIHAYTGIDAAELPSDPSRRLKAVAAYIPAETLGMIEKLYSTDPDQRPTARECIGYIRYPEELTVSPSEELKQSVSPRTDMLIEQAVSALEQTAIEKGNSVYWDSKHGLNAAHMSWGLNTGTGGRLIGLLTLLDKAGDKEKYRALVEKALNYVLENDIPDDIPPGLFTGVAGTALALGTAFQLLGDKRYLDKSYELLQRGCAPGGNYDLYSGYAGIAYTALRVYQVCGEERFMDIADASMKPLLDDRETIDGITAWKVNVQEEKPRYETGAAHGAAGIAMAIALYGVVKQSETHLDIATQCFKEIFEGARSEEKKCFLTDIGVKTRHPASSNIWCHGATGYLWSIVQVPELIDRLRKEAEWAMSLSAGVSHLSNPTYCHGMAGSLELWRMINATSLRTPVTENCYENVLYELVNISQEHDRMELFSSEDSKVFTPDLWIGYLGPVSALALATQKSTTSILNTKW